MAAAGHAGDDVALYETVQAVGMELCPALGISIPVGKDSMSMKTVWRDADEIEHSVAAPVSCVISAFAPVEDTSLTLTPVLSSEDANSQLYFLDLSGGHQRLGCSSLAQVYEQVGCQTPDVNDPEKLKNGFLAVQQMVRQGLLGAYHDRSDGGVLVAAIEMAFASRCGLKLDFSSDSDDCLALLFNEELGMVLQIPDENFDQTHEIIETFDLVDCFKVIGQAVTG